jgi:mannose-6-phosphate isomerase-like protein (cupin superfamily)
MSIILAAMTVLTAMPGRSQEASNEAAAIKTFASSADVQALMAKSKAGRKEGQASVGGHILTLGSYNVNLEYRAIDGPASIHEKEAELIYVLDGEGTLIMGGTIVGEKRTNATNLVGTAIEGGTSRAFRKGDVTIVPAGTAHQFKPNGALVLMTMHVPAQ